MTPLPRALALAALALVLSPSARAVPVQLIVESGTQPAVGYIPGFAYSFLHDATKRCMVLGGVQFCQSGAAQAVSGTLDAELSGLVLSNIMGSLSVAGGPDIVITDGVIDFTSSAADTFGGYLATSSHGTFHYLDHNFAGVANSFDGASLFLWGNNWDTGNPGDPSPFARRGLDLGITVNVLPEPGPLARAAVLLALTTLVLGQRSRRERARLAARRSP
jgi:hypothetical protein